MRTRFIRPGLVTHEILYQLETELDVPARLLWACLPMICDREGYFEWRPMRIRAQLLPFDSVDLEPLLERLVAENMLEKCICEGEIVGKVVNWRRHQRPHHRESASKYRRSDNCTKSDQSERRNKDLTEKNPGLVQGLAQGKGRAQPLTSPSCYLYLSNNPLPKSDHDQAREQAQAPARADAPAPAHAGAPAARGGKGFGKKGNGERAPRKFSAPRWSDYAGSRVIEAAKTLSVRTEGVENSDLYKSLAHAFRSSPEPLQSAVWSILEDDRGQVSAASAGNAG